MDVKVKSLLGEHPSLSLLGNGKVHCSLTNHECPARVESIEQYVNGAKYKKARDWYSHDFSQYEPYLVTSRHNPKRLYCMVTRREVNKIPHEVDVHINRYVSFIFVLSFFLTSFVLSSEQWTL